MDFELFIRGIIVVFYAAHTVFFFLVIPPFLFIIATTIIVRHRAICGWTVTSYAGYLFVYAACIHH